MRLGPRGRSIGGTARSTSCGAFFTSRGACAESGFWFERVSTLQRHRTPHRPTSASCRLSGSVWLGSRRYSQAEGLSCRALFLKAANVHERALRAPVRPCPPAFLYGARRPQPHLTGVELAAGQPPRAARSTRLRHELPLDRRVTAGAFYEVHVPRERDVVQDFAALLARPARYDAVMTGQPAGREGEGGGVPGVWHLWC